MKSKFSLSVALGLSVLSMPFAVRADDKPLLKDAAATTAAPAAAPFTPEEMKAAGEKASKAADKLGWRIGCQAWTFNNRSFFQTIDQLNALGVHYVEAFPGQIIDADKNVKMGPGLSAEVKEAIKKKLADADVKLVSFGVTGIPAKEDEARKFFEWAKEMGIQTIVSEPGEDQFDVLNKLVDEFGINVAIHDHPKPSHYWNPDTVLKVTEGRSKRIGACADVGHWQRSGIPPIEALKKLEGRIIESHFKDLNKFDDKGAHDVTWGTGTGNARGMLDEIHRQNIKITFLVEYEFHSAGLVQEVAHSIAYFGDTCEAITAGK